MKDQSKDMIRNNKLRKKVHILIHEYGVKQSFICEKIGEHKGSFNGWIQETRNYDNSMLYKLDEFIEETYGVLFKTRDENLK